MNNGSAFIINRKQFSQPSLFLDGRHYFPYEKAVAKSGDKLSVRYAFYCRQKKKWFEDTEYLNQAQVSHLFHRAKAAKLIKALPEIVVDFINESHLESIA